jgi:hypothetical protein
MKRILLILSLACLPSCENLSPAQRARLSSAADRILDKALMLGESRLDKALGLPPAATVIPIPAGVAVTAPGK